MSCVIFMILLAYVFGSVPTGYWIGKLLKGIDIREVGSGSTGATNVLRAVGKGPALFVLLFDLGKGFFVVALAILAADIQFRFDGVASHLLSLLPPSGGLSAADSFSRFMVDYALLPPIVAIVSMIGHSKSCFLNFKGGKSAATGLGTVIAMSPLAGLETFVLFVGIVSLTRIVSIASICAGMSTGLFLYLNGAPPSFVIYGLLGGTYVLARHRSNIKRLMAGTEPKIGQKTIVSENSQIAESQESP